MPVCYKAPHVLEDLKFLVMQTYSDILALVVDNFLVGEIGEIYRGFGAPVCVYTTCALSRSWVPQEIFTNGESYV